MPATRKAKKKPAAETGKTRYRRRTFMFDGSTDQETALIQKGLRATTASEAVRYSVRKVAELMTFIKAGGRIYVDHKMGKQGATRTVSLDIPAAQ